MSGDALPLSLDDPEEREGQKQGAVEEEERRGRPFVYNPLRGDINVYSSNRRRWAHLLPEYLDRDLTIERNTSYSWISMTHPASMPLTIDYLPASQKLESRYEKQSYLIRETPPLSSSSIYEMLTQRIAQGYQLIVPEEEGGEGWDSIEKLFSRSSTSTSSASSLSHPTSSTEAGHIPSTSAPQVVSTTSSDPSATSPSPSASTADSSQTTTTPTQSSNEGSLSSASLDSHSTHSFPSYHLSLGHNYQILQRVLDPSTNDISVRVTWYRRKAERSKSELRMGYTYSLWALEMDGYETKRSTFIHKPSSTLDWKQMDEVICGKGVSSIGEKVQFWKIRLSIPPIYRDGRLWKGDNTPQDPLPHLDPDRLHKTLPPATIPPILSVAIPDVNNVDRSCISVADGESRPPPSPSDVGANFTSLFRFILENASFVSTDGEANARPSDSPRHPSVPFPEISISPENDEIEFIDDMESLDDTPTHIQMTSPSAMNGNDIEYPPTSPSPSEISISSPFSPSQAVASIAPPLPSPSLTPSLVSTSSILSTNTPIANLNSPLVSPSNDSLQSSDIFSVLIQLLRSTGPMQMKTKLHIRRLAVQSNTFLGKRLIDHLIFHRNALIQQIPLLPLLLAVEFDVEVAGCKICANSFPDLPRVMPFLDTSRWTDIPKFPLNSSHSLLPDAPSHSLAQPEIEPSVNHVTPSPDNESQLKRESSAISTSSHIHLSSAYFDYLLSDRSVLLGLCDHLLKQQLIVSIRGLQQFTDDKELYRFHDDHVRFSKGSGGFFSKGLALTPSLTSPPHPVSPTPLAVIASISPATSSSSSFSSSSSSSSLSSSSSSLPFSPSLVTPSPSKSLASISAGSTPTSSTLTRPHVWYTAQVPLSNKWNDWILVLYSHRWSPFDWYEMELQWIYTSGSHVRSYITDLIKEVKSLGFSITQVPCRRQVEEEDPFTFPILIPYPRFHNEKEIHSILVYHFGFVFDRTHSSTLFSPPGGKPLQHLSYLHSSGTVRLCIKDSNFIW